MVLVFNKNKKQGTPRDDGNGRAEMKEYQTRIGLLCDIAEEANSITQVSTLLERILKVTQNTVGSMITALFLMDESKARVHLPITVSKYEDDTPRKATVIISEIAGMVAGNITALKNNNVGGDPRFSPRGAKSPGSVVKSVIAAPVLKGKKVIGVIIAANKDGGEFTERDYEVLKGFAATEAVILLVSLEKTAIENVTHLNPALLEGYRNTVNELASTINVKDDHVYDHARRVKDYALMAAAPLSLNSGDLQAIEFGALLHDIGKIGIDSEILRKPGPLSDEEWNIVYTHPQKGADILKDIPHLKDAMDIVLSHHEKYDGTGYPKKLKGDEIPIGARLVAVANAFDTMTTDHPYRPALNAGEAIKELVNSTGSQFCPKAIEAFIAAFNKRQGNPRVKTSPTDARAKEARPARSQITQVQTESKNNAKNIVIKVKKDAREIKALKEKAKRQAKEAKARVQREAREAKIRAEKKAREAKIKAKRDAEAAKLLKIKMTQAAKEAKARAEREAREAKIRAIKTAEAERILKIKLEKEAREAKIRAEKEAKIKARKDAEAAKLLKIKLEKEAKESQEANIKAAREAEEANKAKTQKDAEAAKLHKIKSEKEARESQAAKIQAEREAEEAKKAKAQKDTEAARILKIKSEREANQAKIRTEKEAAEAKIKAEKEAAVSRIQAEKQAQEVVKARKTEKEQKVVHSKLDAEILKGNVRLVVPIAVPTETAKRFGRYMEKIDGVKILMLSHSEEEGHLFLLGLQKPMTLVRLLKDIPLVGKVDKKGATIFVGLKEEMIF
jgi:putative nucleotidyltransferase with HDIG domain